MRDGTTPSPGTAANFPIQPSTQKPRIMIRPLFIAAALTTLAAACATKPRPDTPPPAPTCVLSVFPLFITLEALEIAPGGSATLRVSELQGPAGLKPMSESCHPVWSVSDGAPATISRGGGVLQVAQDAPDGAVFGVVAQVAGVTLEAGVQVFDPVRNPLVGTWRQSAGTPCGSTESMDAGNEAVRELIFQANGSFSVAWSPFETYKDYWGTYTYEVGSGRLRLQVSGGNHVPHDLDPNGQALLSGSGELQLVDMSLGSRSSMREFAFCKATFRR
jgi:hypothetical protein